MHKCSNFNKTTWLGKLIEARGRIYYKLSKMFTLQEFFRCLAICHTVLPEGEETPEKIKYQAASPDESALVVAAKNFGFFFYRYILY